MVATTRPLSRYSPLRAIDRGCVRVAIEVTHEVRRNLPGSHPRRFLVLVADVPRVVLGGDRDVSVTELLGHVGQGDPGGEEVRREGVAEVLRVPVPEHTLRADPSERPVPEVRLIVLRENASGSIRPSRAGSLIVEPAPMIGPGLTGTPYDEASVTLHLGDTVFRPKTGAQLTLDLSQEGNVSATLDAVLTEVEIPEDGIQLKKGDFVLGRVHERVGFPENEKELLMGRIEGRSKFARCGLLVHATAPTLHPLWTGHITLELANLGYFTITLKPRAPVCQLLVERVEGEVASLPGDFDEQTSAIGRR